MFSRGVSILLMWVLCFGLLPLGAPAIVRFEARSQPQGPDLDLTFIQINLAGGGRLLNLTGHHQIGAQRVNLRATTVAGKVDEVARLEISPSNPSSASAPTLEEESRPEEAQYYSYAEMSRSDGPPLVQANYEYQQHTGQNLFHVTLAGVTVTFNLDTQEANPISAADEERVNAWLISEDGRLVQATSVAIIEQGNPEANWELFLNYYAVAMLVDNDPPADSALKIRGKARNLSHHARIPPTFELSKTKEPAFANSCDRSSDVFAASNTVRRYSNLIQPTLANQQGGCFGCCGVRCACIPSPGGPIYNAACRNHDQCTLNAGSRFARQCTGGFIVALLSVWATWRRALPS